MTVFAHSDLEDVIHGRARLTILAFLSTVAKADFVTLRNEIRISDGNLSQHLRKLEDADYITLAKSVSAGKQRTSVELTNKGRNAFYDYIDRLQTLLKVVPERERRP